MWARKHFQNSPQRCKPSRKRALNINKIWDVWDECKTYILNVTLGRFNEHSLQSEFTITREHLQLPTYNWERIKKRADADANPSKIETHFNYRDKRRKKENAFSHFQQNKNIF